MASLVTRQLWEKKSLFLPIERLFNRWNSQRKDWLIKWAAAWATTTHTTWPTQSSTGKLMQRLSCKTESGWLSTLIPHKQTLKTTSLTTSMPSLGSTVCLWTVLKISWATWRWTTCSGRRGGMNLDPRPWCTRWTPSTLKPPSRLSSWATAFWTTLHTICRSTNSKRRLLMFR